MTAAPRVLYYPKFDEESLETIVAEIEGFEIPHFTFQKMNSSEVDHRFLSEKVENLRQSLSTNLTFAFTKDDERIFSSRLMYLHTITRLFKQKELKIKVNYDLDRIPDLENTYRLFATDPGLGYIANQIEKIHGNYRNMAKGEGLSIEALRGITRVLDLSKSYIEATRRKEQLLHEISQFSKMTNEVLDEYHQMVPADPASDEIPGSKPQDTPKAEESEGGQPSISETSPMREAFPVQNSENEIWIEKTDSIKPLYAFDECLADSGRKSSRKPQDRIHSTHNSVTFPLKEGFLISIELTSSYRSQIEINFERLLPVFNTILKYLQVKDIFILRSVCKKTQMMIQYAWFGIFKKDCIESMLRSTISKTPMVVEKFTETVDSFAKKFKEQASEILVNYRVSDIAAVMEGHSSYYGLRQLQYRMLYLLLAQIINQPGMDTISIEHLLQRHLSERERVAFGIDLNSDELEAEKNFFWPDYVRGINQAIARLAEVIRSDEPTVSVEMIARVRAQLDNKLLKSFNLQDPLMLVLKNFCRTLLCLSLLKNRIQVLKKFQDFLKTETQDGSLKTVLTSEKMKQIFQNFLAGPIGLSDEKAVTTQYYTLFQKMIDTVAFILSKMKTLSFLKLFVPEIVRRKPFLLESQNLVKDVFDQLVEENPSIRECAVNSFSLNLDGVKYDVQFDAPTKEKFLIECIYDLLNDCVS